MNVVDNYMSRCFQLAALGNTRVAPNPMVGCVIEAKGEIIGEGWHRCYGSWHAEVNALDSVKKRELLPDATLYVNLEPCSHYGKTPPCADRIIKEGVKRVVVSNLDPNPQVSGRGIKRLQDAGIEVVTGVLEEEGWFLNRRFFTYHTKHRPYIILKWAQTSDGFIDAFQDKPVRISSDITKALVHKMRAENQAIMVGTRTAIKDDPHLNTRRWYGKNPIRVVIDTKGRVPVTNRIFDNSAPTIVIDKAMTPGQIAEFLYEKEIQSIIIEGGRDTLQRFIDDGLYDEVQIEKGPFKCFEGTPSPKITIPNNAETYTIGEQELIKFNNFL
ncbi:MAG: bifunctional diaminohydroxyphosphoribosylaminopyrimidine deaminase/5-amino-6-(5-phosphoribosylamino)uracil reductase RibD [Paludibacteraceae bacterium]|nr:bifunctional diaminohydroxyphosphoribosylaminopyrimidine deaminase/5-amino-6-(5-phosphoribosylamino)uracil reductase RibD [Paludibacteraceae bacterium]